MRPARSIRLMTIVVLLLGSGLGMDATSARGQDLANVSNSETSTTILPSETESSGEDDRSAIPETHEFVPVQIRADVLWAVIASVLVLFMQSGFALVVAGLTRAKNVAHAMGTNVAIYAVGMLGYWVAGFSLQAGAMGIIGIEGLGLVRLPLFGRSFGVWGHGWGFLAGFADDPAVNARFLTHAMVMATAAMIPTGAMAERWKFSASLIYALFVSVILYPIHACWVWGGGWLADLGTNFGLGNGHVDFAGSGVVHLTGGAIALAGAIVLGPRIGKYRADGVANPMPGHNLPMVVLGTLVLAFGWFGLNGGPALPWTGDRLAAIGVNTVLASAAGMVAAVFCTWGVFGKPDPTMACNGLLAGLVVSGAGCAFIDPIGAVILGGAAGLLVVGSVLFVEKVLRVDDPAGAISVHGVCGALGCLGVGLFATGRFGKGWNGVAGKAPTGLFHGGGLDQLTADVIGVLVGGLWAFVVAFVFFRVVDRLIGNRVSAQDEILGLDLAEMGVSGYVDEETSAVRNAGLDYLSTHSLDASTRTPPRTGREIGAHRP